MKNLAKNLTKLQFLLALAAVLVLPTVVRVYAQTTTPDEPVVEEESVEEEAAEEGPAAEEELPAEDLPPEEPIEELPPAPEPTDEEPPATEEDLVVEDVEDKNVANDETDEEPIETDTPQAALDRYLTFAQAEHPGVEVVEIRFVWKNGVKSAKIIFEDGWKVYIGVSDGSTLSVADESNKVHRCQRRMLKQKSYRNWHRQYKSYYQWWKAQQSKQPVDEEESVEENGSGDNSIRAQVRGEASVKDNGGRHDKRGKGNAYDQRSHYHSRRR